MSIRYDIFGRKEHPEPLVYVGSLQVDGADQVADASLAAFGPASEWLEMLAVPHQEIITVFSEYEEGQE